MNEMETRSCALEFREDTTGDTPGRLVGTILTYGERASDRPELFEEGALTWPADGVVLNRQHLAQAPIMRIVPEVRGAAVVVDQPLPATVAGKDAAAELRAGLFKGLSVEFRALTEEYRAGVRRIRTAFLGGVGLVTSPAYANSTAEVRDRAGDGRRWWY